MRVALLALPGITLGQLFDYDGYEEIDLPNESSPQFGSFNYDDDYKSDYTKPSPSNDDEQFDYFELEMIGSGQDESIDSADINLGDSESQKKLHFENVNAEVTQNEETGEDEVHFKVKYVEPKKKNKFRDASKPKKQKIDRTQENYKEIKYLEKAHSGSSALPWADILSAIRMVKEEKIGKKFAVRGKEIQKKLMNYGCWCPQLFPPKRKKSSKKKKKNRKPEVTYPTEWANLYKIPSIKNEKDDGSFVPDVFDSACEKLAKCMRCVEGKDFNNPHQCAYKGKGRKVRPEAYDVFLRKNKESGDVEVVCMNDPEDTEDPSSECKRGLCECHKMFAEDINHSLIEQKSTSKIKGYNKANISPYRRVEECVVPSPVDNRNSGGSTDPDDSNRSVGTDKPTNIGMGSYTGHVNPLKDLKLQQCCVDYPGTLGLYSKYNCCNKKALTSETMKCCTDEDNDSHQKGKPYNPIFKECCDGTVGDIGQCGYSDAN